MELSEEIQKLEAQLRVILGGGAGGGEIPSPFVAPAPPTKAMKGGKKGKRFVSPEARAKMAAAQKARWVKKAKR